MSTKPLGEIIHNRVTPTTETTVRENLKPTVTTDNCKGYQCTPKQVDLLVQDATAAGVVNPRMHGWYCKAAYMLGSEVFMRCVAVAKAEGRNKPKYFSWLINTELTKHKAQAAG